MSLQFLNARNGQLTCSADGRFLHSSFNPQIEAERFASSIQRPFEPSAIIVIGACLPICSETLKKHFPESQLIAIHFDNSFETYSENWDAAFYLTDTSSVSTTRLSESLFSFLGEEKLVTSQFVSWKVSESVWPDEYIAAWSAIKKCMEKAQSVLTTRNWFSKRWFRNTVISLSCIKKYVLPEKTSLPVIVTASGPSLTTALPFIIKNRKHFILLAASSSITTLLAHDIVPDYCISTDGGWYATRHLRSYQTDTRLQNVPLIISPESAVPAPLFSAIPFILLSYGDAIETVLSEILSVPFVKGLRNGTVSGTAAAFAASLTTGSVYMCGLDLAPGSGFQHAEPNENDIPLFTGQSRLKTLETAQASSRYNSGSLTLYREWFSTQGPDFTSRIFRLISEDDHLTPLGNMKDIDFNQLSFPEDASFQHISESSGLRIIDAESDSTMRINKYLIDTASYIEKNPSDKKCRLWHSSLNIKQYINYLRMNEADKEKEVQSLGHNTASIIREVAGNV